MVVKHLLIANAIDDLYIYTIFFGVVVCIILVVVWLHKQLCTK